MNTKTRAILLILLVVLVLAVIAFVVVRSSFPAQKVTTGTSVKPVTASYYCDSGKSITAVYNQGEYKPSTDTNSPPTPTGSVDLTLSDGRTMTLPQTISADGGRYANSGETIIFWDKGNGLTFTENGQQSYKNCVVVASDPGGLTQVYTNSTIGFSLRIPTGFTVDDKYTYQELGPGKDIVGVKFTIPKSISAGTNLGSDSYLSVEEIPNTKDCSANLFLDVGGANVNLSPTIVNDGDTTYSMASSTGAGAGNRYEESVYTIPGTNPCITVRYFIHYGVLENYPTGTVKQFDNVALTNLFDSIRRTLTIVQ
jgi:membrane-bound inhibitor of C-type lysozyme